MKKTDLENRIKELELELSNLKSSIIASKGAVKQVEQERAERLRFYTENAPMAVVEWDSDFIVTKWTGDAEKMFGWSAEETIGKPIMDLNMIFESDIPIVQNTMEKLTNGLNNHVVSTNRNYKKDRSIITCKWYNTILSDENGKMLSVLSRVLDITERKKAEKALKESKERFQSLVETISDFIWEIDSNGVYTYCSPQIEKLWGLKPVQMLGKSPFSLIPPEDRDQTIKAFFELSESQLPLMNLEIRSFDSSNQIKFLEICGVPFFDDAGKLCGYRGITRDITERKKAEEELNKSQLLLSSTMNSQKDTIIFSIDKNYNYLIFNKAHADAMKYAWNVDVTLGMNILDCITSDDDRLLAKKNYDRALMGESHSAVQKFGTVNPAYYESFFNPIRDDKNEIIGCTGLARNITKRKQVEEALMKSNQLLRDTGKMAKVGGWEFDMETLEQLWTEEVYKIHEVDMTYKPTVSEGINFYDPTSKPIIDRAVQHAIQYGEPFDVELELITAKGNLRWVHAIGKADQEHGKVFGTIQDITERKQAESELLESEKKFSTLVNSMDEGYCIIEMIFDKDEKPADYRLLMINSAFEKQTGLIDAEGKKMRELAPNHEQHWFDIYGKIALTGEPIRFVEEAAELNRWYDVYAFRYGKAENRQVAILFKDITERKQVEEQLKLSEYNLKERIKEINGLNSLGLLAEKFEKLEDIFTEFVNIVLPESMQFPEKVTVSLEVENKKFTNIENFKPLKNRKYLSAPITALKVQIGELIVGYTEDLPFIEFFEQQLVNNYAVRISKIIEVIRLRDSLVMLNNRLEDISENERTLISRELHDQLGQSLSALKIDIGWLSGKIPSDSKEGAKLQGIAELVTSTIKDIQRISSELHPAMLEDLGLCAAIQWYCGEFKKRTGIDFHLKLDEIQLLDEKRGLALYRILQEALTNVMRHANAKKVDINLYQADDSVILEVIDDGIGLEKKKINSYKSLGFIGMRERAKKYNGSIDISSALNKGTKLSVSIPFN